MTIQRAHMARTAKKLQRTLVAIEELISPRQGWKLRAACNPENGLPQGAWWTTDDHAGRDIFFPSPGHSPDLDAARWTCFTCPVQEACKAYREIEGCEYGLWAGELVSPKVGRTRAKSQVQPEPVGSELPDLLEL